MALLGGPESQARVDSDRFVVRLRDREGRKGLLCPPHTKVAPVSALHPVTNLGHDLEWHHDRTRAD